MQIKSIQDKIKKGEYRFSDHAVKKRNGSIVRLGGDLE